MGAKRLRTAIPDELAKGLEEASLIIMADYAGRATGIKATEQMTVCRLLHEGLKVIRGEYILAPVKDTEAKT